MTEYEATQLATALDDLREALSNIGEIRGLLTAVPGTNDDALTLATMRTQLQAIGLSWQRRLQDYDAQEANNG
jgi:hypothetical protein